VIAREPRKLVLRFDRTCTTASQVAAALMSQIEVLDFTLSEPDLSAIVKQIYTGALRGPGVSAR
jgi:ABC-2 type transport system ATP-binding protein